MIADALSIKDVEDRRNARKLPTRVAFRVACLYGLSSQSTVLPLNETEGIDSGQICLTADPEADASTNIGLIDFEKCSLTVRYGAQIVFPGLYELITSRRHEASLLNPIRVIATDECTLTPDNKGFRALGCLDFLPGSLWSGASGG
jgi:hypothetical protein